MPTISGLSVPVGCSLVPGGAIGEHQVNGNIVPGDTLLSVEHITDGSPPTRVDRTAEFSISATKAGVIENTTTDTTGGFLHVTWAKAEQQRADSSNDHILHEIPRRDLSCTQNSGCI